MIIKNLIVKKIYLKKKNQHVEKKLLKQYFYLFIYIFYIDKVNIIDSRIKTLNKKHQLKTEGNYTI